MIDDPQTATFGLAVIGVGILFAKFGTGLPQAIAASDAERAERDFLERRSRRRLGVAALFIICGVLLLTSGLVDAEARPQLSFYLAMAAVPLMLWAILLAVADGYLTRTHARRELRVVETERERMERELARYREQADE